MNKFGGILIVIGVLLIIGIFVYICYELHWLLGTMVLGMMLMVLGGNLIDESNKR